MYNKGLALDHLGRYEEAVTYFDKVLEINPDFAYALNGKVNGIKWSLLVKGLALIALGRSDEALTYFDNLLEISPKNLLALNNKE